MVTYLLMKCKCIFNKNPYFDGMTIKDLQLRVGSGPLSRILYVQIDYTVSGDFTEVIYSAQLLMMRLVRRLQAVTCTVNEYRTAAL